MLFEVDHGAVCGCSSSMMAGWNAHAISTEDNVEKKSWEISSFRGVDPINEANLVLSVLTSASF